MMSTQIIETDVPGGAAPEPDARIPGDPFIRVSGLSKSYTIKRRGQKPAVSTILDGLEFEIGQGEFVSVIGPSGCGKTTLLNMVAGLTEPTSGSITVAGKEVNGPGADRGVVFQQDAIFPWRTVQRNVEYGLEVRGVPRAERQKQVRRFIDMVGLSEYVDYLPKQLSGGMKKRVAIATVLANNPDVLLMDEPFGALDYSTRVRLQDELIDIWQKNRITTIFVTHDIEEALYLSDRILVLSDGGLAEDYRVPFGRPRHPDIRMSAEIQQAKAHLWGYL